MKIAFGKIYIADGRQEPSAITVSSRRKAQTENIIGAKKAKIFDRGNCTYSVEFSIEARHASELEAQLFLLTQGALLQEESPANLAFELEPNPKESRAYISFKNAVLLRASASIDGFTTTHGYEFSATEIERLT